MIKDGQVLELRRLLAKGLSLAASARMTLMDEKTARGYRDDQRLPSQRKQPRTYRTRLDPFADVWLQVQRRLEAEPRLQAKTLFDWLQEQYPGRFLDSTRRTFERRVAHWRSTAGPGRPVIFEQVHHPGRLASSDFTVMNDLGVKIAGLPFEHTLFHCVLTYSNVESVSLCFSESFEALSAGLQKAFWEFGGVPQRHRTDSLSAAINNHSDRKTLTTRYAALMEHYGSRPERTNARCAHENGDVESSHGHLKTRLDQALLLRGSREFASREEYMNFVEGLIAKANQHRRPRFAEEQRHLARLPAERLATEDVLLGLRVSRSSTIRVRNNTYSVPSRLIGRQVDVKVGAEFIDVTHGGVAVQRMPRLLGQGGASINYRHVIDALLRKPGAFENYKYREEMFPTSHFRIAYDLLLEAHAPQVADKNYLQLLALAAQENQDAVQDALRLTIQAGASLDVEEIRSLVAKAAEIPLATDVEVEPPRLSDFDCLLEDPANLETPGNEPISTTNRQAPRPQEVASILSSDVPCAPDSGYGRGPDTAIDRAVPRTAAAQLPGSVCRSSPARGDGEPDASGVSLGAGDARMRGATRGPDQAVADALPAAAGQELGVVQLGSSAPARDQTMGEPSRRLVLGSAGKLAGLWQAGGGEESCPVRIGGATDLATGPQPAVHDVQLARATAVDRQAGLAVAEDDQATLELRGA